MKWVVLGLILFFTLRGIFSYMDENALRAEVAFAPMLGTTAAIDAGNVANAIRNICAKAQCEIDESTLVVNVGAAENVGTNVYAGGLQVSAKGPSQPVDFRLTCKRMGAFYFKRPFSVEVSTRAPGIGPASRWPAETAQ